MSKPLTVFPDAVLVTLAALRDSLAAHPEAVASGLTISRTLPTRDVYTAHPALLVADDGDAGDSNPITETALMRLTVWDVDAFRALRLARLARAHLLAYSGGGLSRGFTSASHPFSAEDPDDGAPLASLTITVRLRPE